jgi:hypothetical protein
MPQMSDAPLVTSAVSRRYSFAFPCQECKGQRFKIRAYGRGAFVRIVCQGCGASDHVRPQHLSPGIHAGIHAPIPGTIEAMAPWKAKGMSRATWYRRQAEARNAGR